VAWDDVVERSSIASVGGETRQVRRAEFSAAGLLSDISFYFLVLSEFN